MKIITLTLNPAFDIHCYTENFQPFHENLAKITAFEAGGKGINISRALSSNGVENTALVVLGRENGDAFLKKLAEDGMNVVTVPVDGRIRENITLHTDNADETRISFAGFSAAEGLLERVEAELTRLWDGAAILTVTGRNPEGISIDGMLEMLDRLKAKGAKIVIDSRSFDKASLIKAKPWLIKPNEEEISAYTDIDVSTVDGARSAAEALRFRGIENVMISLGARGALLACKDGCYVARAPKINALSTIGAGDSAIGGFCAAAAEGLGYADMLKYSVCYGSAACLTEGTRPPLAKDVERLLGEITVERIG